MSNEVLRLLKQNDPDKKLRQEGKLPPLRIINASKYLTGKQKKLPAKLKAKIIKSKMKKAKA